ncbi:hypothetical protein BDP81DRAFT_428701 [Colletotrichum phormii]|uniref:NAD(P)-binding protein n=1 Tax=Colletotrichum phormii TaxID=359342 RepID=A0AAI9ZPQ6_9PEZI|nr:uncharacterized protein BDP81DRAFT_428701 [Colletotrichum phormii]KAK1635922.1 hypothetical protein BDP81DRAFT_428701 [Colletotrichum phormii]
MKRDKKKWQEEMEASFKTNFHGPLNVARAFLPFMRAKATGTLVYVSSQATWHVDVGAGAYSASKFALEGAIETLSKELSILAPTPRVLIMEPGYFRTKVFTNVASVPARLPEFAEFNAAIRAGAEALPGTEPGDPEKAVARIVELVKGDGMVGDKGQVPLRVVLWSDGWERIRNKCLGVLEGLKGWEDVARSADL